MIYVTGDTHIPIDIRKLNTTNFPEQKRLSKDDYVIICGDFGAVWDGSNEERYWQKWLKNKNFTTLFVDGNHENHLMLNEYEVEIWMGGKVHKINDSVIHLMRGQVYNIDGYNFFTMGGGESIDKMYRVEGKTWWKEEVASKEEFNEALDNLEANNWNVDYIITHTTSSRIMEQLVYIKENNDLNSFFNILHKDLKYKHWYFGHFHDDIDIDEKHTLVFDRVLTLVE
jgi:predicted phosphodiesterase